MGIQRENKGIIKNKQRSIRKEHGKRSHLIGNYTDLDTKSNEQGKRNIKEDGVLTSSS